MSAIQIIEWLQVGLGIGVLVLMLAFVLMVLGVAWHFAFHAGDALAAENHGLWQRVEAAEKKYQDLLYQVGTIHPGETRHETAKRYLIDAERRSMGDGQPSALARSPEHPGGEEAT